MISVKKKKKSLSIQLSINILKITNNWLFKIMCKDCSPVSLSRLLWSAYMPDLCSRKRRKWLWPVTNNTELLLVVEEWQRKHRPKSAVLKTPSRKREAVKGKGQSKVDSARSHTQVNIGLVFQRWWKVGVEGAENDAVVAEFGWIRNDQISILWCY